MESFKLDFIVKKSELKMHSIIEHKMDDESILKYLPHLQHTVIYL